MRSASNQLSSLQQRLEDLLGNVQNKRVLIAVSTTRERHYASVTDDAVVEDHAAQWTFPIGCIVKLFTAFLITDAVSRRELELDSLVTEFFGGRTLERLASGITIKDLLNHTH